MVPSQIREVETSKPKNVQKPLTHPSQTTEVKQIKEVRRKTT